MEPLNHPLWYGTSGPIDAPVVLVGESWGAEEAIAQVPFVGRAGSVLFSILAEALPHIDLPRRDNENFLDYRNRFLHQAGILLTNVVSHRPMNNEMWRLFHGKDENSERVGGLQPSGLVVSEVRRLYSQINYRPRKLVVVAGNYALWATSNCTGVDYKQDAGGRRTPTGIQSWRGSMYYMLHSRFDNRGVAPTKLLPIVHPAAIDRVWSLRAVTVHDLKTRVPQALNDDWRPDPAPTLLAPPTFEQALYRLKCWNTAADKEGLALVGDLETIPRRKLVACIGLADSKSFAMSVPFIRPINRAAFEPYWEPKEEVALLKETSKLIRNPKVLWVGQNFNYDCHYIRDFLGADPSSYEDTMLMHHLLFPGTQKDLGYLASLYCRHYWHWKEDSKDWDLKMDLPQLLQYNATDCIRTFEVWEELHKLHKQLDLHPLWERRRQHLALARDMMRRGVRIDLAVRSQFSIELLAKRDELHGWFEKIIPQSWVAEAWERVKERPFKSKTPWYASGASEQQKILFRDVLGCRLPNARKTGRPTLGKEALPLLKEKNPMLTRLFDALQALRSLDVYHSHFIRVPLDPDGRMRCDFNPGGTESFRWNSSQNPFGRGTNLQNIPEGTKE